MAQLPVRHAARVVLRDPDGRVLLFFYDDPPPNGPHWLTPGGGLDEGETHEQAALREVAEETGWTDVVLGPELGRGAWDKESRGRLVHQVERWFAGTVEQPRRALGEVAAMHLSDRIADWRWWDPAELAATSERVLPEQLRSLVTGT